MEVPQEVKGKLNTGRTQFLCFPSELYFLFLCYELECSF